MNTQEIAVLNLVIAGMDGRVIVRGPRSIGFAMGDGKNRELYKLDVVRGTIFLEQLSGREKGKRAEVATLADLVAAAADRAAQEAAAPTGTV